MKKSDVFLAVGRYSHIGLLFGILTVGGFFLGWTIDKKIQSFPAFSILIFLLGFSLGMYKFILMALSTRGKQSNENRDSGNGR